MSRITEPLLNGHLRNALALRHPKWPSRLTAERTGALADAVGRPDIILNHPGGVPVVIETEFMPAAGVECDAIGRLGQTLEADGRSIEQAVAVRVPSRLAETDDSDIRAELEAATLEFCVLSGDPKRPNRWPAEGWLPGGIDELADCIDRTALSEARISQGIDILERGVGQAATLLRSACEEAPAPLQTIADSLHQQDGMQTTRMAMAIVANAFTFHLTIVGTKGRDSEFTVLAPSQLRGATGRMVKSVLLEHWRRILEEINYWPIFRIASDMLNPIPNGTAQTIIERMATIAGELAGIGMTSQQDLAGRMFQRLIADRKFLATFYTLPSSAALLAELAVGRMAVDWSDADALGRLRIADFACGTGALLGAAYGAIRSRHRLAGQDDAECHQRMMEQVLVGTDIMPAAAHLTASLLSSAHPRRTFRSTAVMTLPYGEQPRRTARLMAIGALDLLAEESVNPLFGSGRERLRGRADDRSGEVPMPHGSFDLVIMNPPFTRSTAHEAERANVPMPAFAGFTTTDEVQERMAARLKGLRRPDGAGDGNAGLASNFIDIAHAMVKPGGTIALVLPASFAQGEAWAGARQLIGSHYRDVAVVSIAAHGSTDRAFSADTKMAEVLVVATRLEKGGRPDGRSLYVNLHRRPGTIMAATVVARAVRSTPKDAFESPIRVGTTETAGLAIRSVLEHTGCAGLREATIARAAVGLTESQLHLPRHLAPFHLPMVRLDELGRRGLLDRDISGTERNSSGLPRGPFDVEQQGGGVPTWPMLWAHSAPRERRLIVQPDRAGRVRADSDTRAAQVWRSTASRLHFNRDFQINSQSLAACLTPEQTIGGRAWPNFVCNDLGYEIPTLLWANTTLGLVAFWWTGTRQQQGRVTITISRLPDLPMLDARRLTVAQLEQCAAIFEEFGDRTFLPANEAWQDASRRQLDRAMLLDVLGLEGDVMDGLETLRRQWCSEPSVHGGKSTRPDGTA